MESLQEMCGDWITVLLLLGLFSALRMVRDLVASLVSGVRSYVLPALLGPVDAAKSYGGWALVTGCTGGIGREYALGLAAKGMDVVLISRSRNKLEQLEEEVRQRYGVRALIIEADFTQVGILAEIVKQVEGIEVGVLVNNVGVNGGGIMPFCEMEIKNVMDLISVNMTAATVLCHALIPPMVRRGRGAVINIGSIGGFIKGPYYGQYVASKHYIHVLTEAVTVEYKDTGVFIQEVNPGLVETAMTENLKEKLSDTLVMPSASRFVSWSLATLGWTHQTCGYWFHSLQLPIYTSLPIWMLAKMNKGMYEKEKLKKND